MRLFFAFSLFFTCYGLVAQQNQPPVIQNVATSISWQTDLLTLTFDVSDAENDPLEISVAISTDQSVYYDVVFPTPTGDIGYPVTPGTNKTIVIDLGGLTQALTGAWELRLVADDKQPVDIQALVNEVDSVRLRQELEYVQGVRHRTTGSAHLYAVRDSLFSYYRNLELEASGQYFTLGSYTATNVLGHQFGSTQASKVVIIDAHYDSVSNAPGADDNGSGVVGTMEAARVLSRFPSKKTIRYIGFDLEEAGLIGSTRYNTNGIPSNEQIEGVFNFEMIGYYSDVPNSQELPAGFNLLFPAVYNELVANEFRGNFITNVGNTNSQTLALLFANSAQQYVPDLKVITLVVPGNGSIAPDLTRSDHAPFWAANRKALMLTDGAEFRNECYHTPGDTLDEKLNFTFMSNVVKATVAATAQLAELQHGDWKRIYFSPSLIVGAEEPIQECGFQITQTADQIVLQTGTCTLAQARADWYDESGRLVQTNTFSAPASGQVQWGKPSLPTGIYVLKINYLGGFWSQKIFLR
jgi:hypothetical protein